MWPTVPDRSTGPEMPMPTPITSERAMPGLAEHDVHERDGRVERRRLRVVDVELELALGQHRRREVGGGHADVVVAEVDAERGARGRVEPQQRRRPAAARGLEV